MRPQPPGVPPVASTTAHGCASAAHARIGAGSGQNEVGTGPGQYSQSATVVSATTAMRPSAADRRPAEPPEPNAAATTRPVYSTYPKRTGTP